MGRVSKRSLWVFPKALFEATIGRLTGSFNFKLGKVYHIKILMSGLRNVLTRASVAVGTTQHVVTIKKEFGSKTALP